MNNGKKQKTCLIFCKCTAGIISKDRIEALEKAFKSMQIDVCELQDLCACSLTEKKFLKKISKSYENKLVVACYPRAVENLFKQNNIEFENYEVLNFREMPVEQIIETIKSKTECYSANAAYTIKKSQLKVPAWFPVIDKSRCTLCGQCSRFCLFGVYEFNKKSLNVVNPLACKNNCPACGRTCPASAIIFPRLPENSVLSGAKPGEEKSVQKPAENGGLFVLLNERNNSRKNIFRQGLMMQAEDERKKALEELKQGLIKKQ